MADIPWDLRRRALKDSLRHDSGSKRRFARTCKELIAEESIITSDGQKLVRIPLRYLDQYRFRLGPQGRGHGPGQPGDRLGTAWRAMATAGTALSSRRPAGRAGL